MEAARAEDLTRGWWRQIPPPLDAVVAQGMMKLTQATDAARQPQCSHTHATGEAPTRPSPGPHLDSTTVLDAIQALRTTVRVRWTQFEHCRPQFEHCKPQFERAELDPERG
jgi:hypothetical protein